MTSYSAKAMSTTLFYETLRISLKIYRTYNDFAFYSIARGMAANVKC